MESETPPPLPTHSPHPKHSHGNPFQKKQAAKRRQRISLFVLGGIVLLGIAAFIAWLGTRGGILILEPNDSFTVTLNGEQARLQDQKGGVFIHTRPGLYRLTLSKPGFASFAANVDIGRGQIVKIRPTYSILPKEVQESGNTVAFVRSSKDEKYVYYLGNNGQTIYRITVANQTEVPITVDQLGTVDNIEWSDGPDLALITTSDGSYLQEIPIYNFTSQIQTKIAGPEVGSPVWDPNDDDRLAFTYNPSDGEHSLVFSDIHISALDRKADISSIPDPKLVWAPDSDHILLIPRSSDTGLENLWEYDTVNGSMKQLTQGGDVSDADFSPGGDTIMYGQSGDLKTVRPDGGGEKDLKVSGQVSQVAWHDDGSFYLPDNSANLLKLISLNGTSQQIPFSFPNTAIQGMTYFPDNHTLIFYTSSSIYLADLSK